LSGVMKDFNRKSESPGAASSKIVALARMANAGAKTDELAPITPPVICVIVLFCPLIDVLSRERRQPARNRQRAAMGGQPDMA
jgi:hypothetical protein